MKDMKAKLKQQGGFTLIEMLLVVAIIAILAAISVPVVNMNLEKARDAADQANERAAKSITLLYFMGAADGADIPGGTVDFDDVYQPGMAILDPDVEDESLNIQRTYYDAEKGNLTYNMPVAYGQCTGCFSTYGDGSTHVGQVIQVMVTEKGEFSLKWVTGRPDKNPENDPNYDPWEGL